MLSFPPEDTGLRAYDLASLVTSTETRRPNTMDFTKNILLYTRKRRGLFLDTGIEQVLYGWFSVFLSCLSTFINTWRLHTANINQGCPTHGPPRFAIWPASTFANDIYKNICIYYTKYIIFTHAARKPALTMRNFRFLPQSGWDPPWTEKLSRV
jgi:hypothetical protein